MSKVTIIMYHYVRDLKHSRYPEIKGLDVELFKEQLRYILKYYEVIKMEDLIAAAKGQKTLANNSLLLSFDDGYKDHFEFVFPILNDAGIQGSFFPSAKAIAEHRVLDVNKIHFILAAVVDKKRIIEDIFAELDKFREEYSLDSNEYYYQKQEIAWRYDTADVIFIKRMMQKELPEKLRNKIVNFLFQRYVTKDENSFSQELYMNVEQLKHLRAKGMHIGSHSYDHCWMDILSKERQAREIELSLEFLKKIGNNIENFVFNYPYGVYNESLLSLLKEKECGLALTTEVAIADLDKGQPLALPRLDTNDLPKDSSLGPNNWTLEVIGVKK